MFHSMLLAGAMLVGPAQPPSTMTVTFTLAYGSGGLNSRQMTITKVSPNVWEGTANLGLRSPVNVVLSNNNGTYWCLSGRGQFNIIPMTIQQRESPQIFTDVRMTEWDDTASGPGTALYRVDITP